MWLGLVPERNTGKIVAATVGVTVLNRHANLALKDNRVFQMKPV